MSFNSGILGNTNPMKADFEQSAKFFNLSPEAKDMAWASARQCPQEAAACYRAIVNSLPKTKPAVVVVPSKLPRMGTYVPGQGMGGRVSL